jgi:hypothetical protein
MTSSSSSTQVPYKLSTAGWIRLPIVMVVLAVLSVIPGSLAASFTEWPSSVPYPSWDRQTITINSNGLSQYALVAFDDTAIIVGGQYVFNPNVGSPTGENNRVYSTSNGRDWSVPSLAALSPPFGKIRSPYLTRVGRTGQSALLFGGYRVDPITQQITINTVMWLTTDGGNRWSSLPSNPSAPSPAPLLYACAYYVPTDHSIRVLGGNNQSAANYIEYSAAQRQIFRIGMPTGAVSVFATTPTSMPFLFSSCAYFQSKHVVWGGKQSTPAIFYNGLYLSSDGAQFTLIKTFSDLPSNVMRLLPIADYALLMLGGTYSDLLTGLDNAYVTTNLTGELMRFGTTASMQYPTQLDEVVTPFFLQQTLMVLKTARSAVTTSTLFRLNLQPNWSTASFSSVARCYPLNTTLQCADGLLTTKLCLSQLNTSMPIQTVGQTLVCGSTPLTGAFPCTVPCTDPTQSSSGASNGNDIVNGAISARRLEGLPLVVAMTVMSTLVLSLF